ncbi:MAG: CBS domain-containing protein [Marinilabiliales bacterium]|nr:CBS domain-containing protein [Marinilabiliales bacterium]
MSSNASAGFRLSRTGHLIGLLSVADLIHAIAQIKIKDEIKDNYTSQTFALWEETPLPVVGRVMEISGVDAIPILDAENRLQGIISERDLIRNSSIEDSCWRQRFLERNG